MSPLKDTAVPLPPEKITQKPVLRKLYYRYDKAGRRIEKKQAISEVRPMPRVG